MSSLDNLKTRIDFNGGQDQEKRMNLDKLRSLKKALLYSYQAQTAILEDEREFKCLINHDKLKEDYDDKIISIPYKDICLNSKSSEEQEIGMKVGDTFTWKETDTKWIVIQEILEENAYFRGTIRKAEDEIIIDGKTYYGYLGKWTKNELWHTKKSTSWSEMGYEVVLYITRKPETEEYFERFKKIWISGKYWEVQFVNDVTSDTLLLVYLKETFINEFEDEDSSDIEPEPEPTLISGKDSLYPYDTAVYQVQISDENGYWELSNNKAKIDSQNTREATITITSAKSGKINLNYIVNELVAATKEIIIKSF